MVQKLDIVNTADGIDGQCGEVEGAVGQVGVILGEIQDHGGILIVSEQMQTVAASSGRMIPGP